MSAGWLSVLTESGRLLAFRPGCTTAEIEAAEAQLGVTIPAELASLLRATNGFTDVGSRFQYGWPLDIIVIENQRAWSDAAMPLDDTLLAFGADGAGAWFCVPTDASDGPIYHWSPVDAEARRVGTDLRSFWHGWLSGSTKV